MNNDLTNNSVNSTTEVSEPSVEVKDTTPGEVITAVIPEWSDPAWKKRLLRQYRVVNDKVKAKEVVYSEAMDEVAAGLDMLNSNIRPTEDPESDFVIKDRSYSRDEYVSKLTKNLKGLLAPRAITFDGEEERYGRSNLRPRLERKSSNKVVTPEQFGNAIKELARYAGATYTASNEADDGKDVLALANVNVAKGDRCTGSDTLPIDVIGVDVLISDDKAYTNWVSTVINDVIDNAIRF